MPVELQPLRQRNHTPASARGLAQNPSSRKIIGILHEVVTTARKGGGSRKVGSDDGNLAGRICVRVVTGRIP